MRRLNAEQRTKVIEAIEPVNPEGLRETFMRAHAGGNVRVEQWDGKSWLVAQTVAVVSKVLNGELLPAKEIETFVEAWNGRAVPLRHPQINGFYVSANSPEILEQFNVGYFFNARSEPHDLGVKIVGEMWIDVERAKGLEGGAAIVDRLNDGDVIEVSTAYWCKVEEGRGVFNGVPYNGIQRDIKPDHIAILPDQLGACSVADGCGVGRTNAQGEDEELTPNLDAGQSAMVAVYLSPSASAAFIGGEGYRSESPKDFHVTLAYLGEGEDVLLPFDELASAVEWVANQFFSFTARVTGEFRFYGEDEDAVGFLVSGEMLNRMRSAVVGELEWSGQPVTRSGEYIPHLTMGYTSGEDVVQLPTPGVDRFAVTEIVLVYGEDAIRFPLRGELGVNYRTRATYEEEGEEMSELKNCTDPKVNEEESVPGSPVEPTNVVGIDPDTLAKISGFMERVESLGGLDAIEAAMTTIAANAAAERAEAIAVIKANAADVYTEEDLGEMSTDQLIKLGKILSATNAKVKTPVLANYGAANVPAVNREVKTDPNGLRPFGATSE